MMKDLISIIVPAYNVEQYIDMCLSSLLNQTYENLEIIIVNDGSTDGTLKICERYSKADNRFKLYTHSNRGLGYSYNKGITLSTGKYICFVEPDDWVDNDYVYLLHEAIVKSETDFIKSDFYIFNSKKIESEKNIRRWNFGTNNDSLTIYKFPNDKKILLSGHSSIWSGIYNKELIKNLVFTETPGASYQDFYFNISLTLAAKSFGILNKALYHYRIESNGNSSILRKDFNLDYFNTQFRLALIHGTDKKDFPILCEMIMYSGLRTCFHFYNQINSEYKNKFFNNTYFATRKFIQSFNMAGSHEFNLFISKLKNKSIDFK